MNDSVFIFCANCAIRGELVMYTLKFRIPTVYISAFVFRLCAVGSVSIHVLVVSNQDLPEVVVVVEAMASEA